MFNTLLTLIYHEMLLTLRQAHSWITPILFFIIIICLFPLAIGSHSKLLNQIAPGVIWVAALLSILLSIDTIFKSDLQEGFLDLLLLSSYPLSLLVLAKTISHWLLYCLPLIIISPILGLLLQLTLYQEYALVMSLLLGTPVLSLLGAIGAALVVGIRGAGLLLPVLIMPLYIPILIFGTGTIIAAGTQQPLAGYFAILGALSLFSLAGSPWLTAAALRTGVSQL